MKCELEDGRPRDGDLVRMIRTPDGPIMVVIASELGEDHVVEGVRNGILCTWDANGEEVFEVFQPGQLEIVSRPL